MQAVGNRLWFVKEVTTQKLVLPKWHYIPPYRAIKVTERLFTFRPSGKSQIIAQGKVKLEAIDDLNGDGFPELITRQPFGIETFEPERFSFRLSEGEWQSFEVPIPIKIRKLTEGIWAEITNGMQLGRYFSRATTVRWDDKKWFCWFGMMGFRKPSLSPVSFQSFQ